MQRFHHRIRAKAANPWEPPVLVVAFGDSVTQGATTLDAQLHDEVYHERFRRLLCARYPLSTFSVLNAGVSGQTAAGALSLVDRDVVRHQPDLTLVAFGLNDAWNGSEDVENFSATLHTLVERVRQQTSSDVILLTPNFMNTRVPLGADDDGRAGYEASASLQTSGVLSAYADAVRRVASMLELPCADVYRNWAARAAAGVDTDAMLANHMNHPTADAHDIPARLLLEIVTTTEPSVTHPRRT